VTLCVTIYLKILQLYYVPGRFYKETENQKYIDAKALVKALEEPSPVSIRINKSKWSKIPLKLNLFCVQQWVLS